MKTTTTTVLIEATNETVQGTFEKIKQYVTDKGYKLEGELKQPTNLLGIKKALTFDSRKKMKVLRNYINRLDKKVSMRNANMFLHFLFRVIYKQDAHPRVELSDKEQKIQQARKAWKKVAMEAETLRLAYKAEKGDFYKK